VRAVIYGPAVDARGKSDGAEDKIAVIYPALTVFSSPLALMGSAFSLLCIATGLLDPMTVTGLERTGLTFLPSIAVSYAISFWLDGRVV
jgi:hypothetical protein